MRVRAPITYTSLSTQMPLVTPLHWSHASRAVATTATGAHSREERLRDTDGIMGLSELGSVVAAAEPLAPAIRGDVSREVRDSPGLGRAAARRTRALARRCGASRAARPRP